MSESGEWHIDPLEVENFRRFEHFDLALDPSLTVLVGANGTGKTAILDAVAIMLSTIVREFEGETRGFLTDDAREVPHDLDSLTAVARMDAVYPVRVTVQATLAGDKFWWRRERVSAKGRTSWGEKNSQVGQAIARVWRALAARNQLRAIALACDTMLRETGWQDPVRG